mmetsp:Transcript_4556/g.9195  ORF Transcript_4556/g.9195 Transcript_4556/m.9195 type:complete len:193 (+) Transcript_4556:28-606(+)
MSEESKTAEGDFVMMGSGSVVPGRGTVNLGLDDPNLSQEEKDHRLAIAMQQQENAAAYNEHKKKAEMQKKAQTNRTARSGTFTKLAAVRDKDHGMLSVPSAYTSDNAYHKDSSDYVAPSGGEFVVAPPKNATPQELADFKVAAEMQKFEQIDAGTTRTMEKIVTEEAHEEEAQSHRTERSNFHINQKGLFKH